MIQIKVFGELFCVKTYSQDYFLYANLKLPVIYNLDLSCNHKIIILFVPMTIITPGLNRVFFSHKHLLHQLCDEMGKFLFILRNFIFLC